MERKFKNEELAKAVEVAKRHGLKVWTFKPSVPNQPIGQIFFDNGIVYGSASAGLGGGIDYSTCHKPNRSYGTGFGCYPRDDSANIESILMTFRYAPPWALQHHLNEQLIKISFEKMAKTSILEYYEL